MLPRPLLRLGNVTTPPPDVLAVLLLSLARLWVSSVETLWRFLAALESV